jgi:uncharacterized peroxidase-related enzyme
MKNDTVYHVTLSPKTPETASGSAPAILAETQKQLGFVPNMYANMANAPDLLDTYIHGYRLFRQNPRLSPAEQEVIFLVISRENGCRYCVAAHTMLAYNMSNVPAAVIEAIRHGTSIPEPRLRALAAFTQVLLQTRGNPSTDAAHEFLSAGYTELHVLDIIHAIAIKTLSNYTNHVFHTALDPQLVAHAWSPALRSRAAVS